MSVSQTYLSFLLFIGVAGVGALLSSASRKHYTKLSAGPSASTDSIECALLELQNPPKLHGITQILENDDIITKVVKGELIFFSSYTSS